MSRPRRLISAMLGFLLSSCATFIAPPEIAAPRDQGDARAAWAEVLARFVDKHGRIDFDGVARDRGALDRYVRYIAEVSPEAAPALFPDAADRLAYHINAYNALAMYTALEKGLPESLDGLLTKAGFFYFAELAVGGRRISLYDYENDVIRPFGEPRVHFALNCMVRGCPRLPRLPFEAATLDEQLEAAAREFFSEARNLRVDHAARTVWLSEILDFYPEDFLARAPSLIAYANQYLTDPIPEDYRVRFIPYDWTLNRQD